MTLRAFVLPALLMLAAAEAARSEPPAIGAKAPDFALSTLAGDSVRLSEEYAKGPVVLVLLRGFPGYQCPLCNKQVRDFTKMSAGFSEAGARVLLVYPGGPADLAARAKEFLVDKDLPASFQLLLDPDYEFTKSYDLRWDAPKETSYPSTFLIDRQGTIFFRKISRSHGDRTSASDVLEQLRKQQK